MPPCIPPPRQVMLRLNTPYLTAPDGAPHGAAAAPSTCARSAKGSAPAATEPAGGGGDSCRVHDTGGGGMCTCQAQGGGRGWSNAGTVISASHFLPHPALPSAPGVLELRKAVGCAALGAQVAALGARAHVYGHTHINGAVELPGAGTSVGGAQAGACTAQQGASGGTAAGGRPVAGQRQGGTTLYVQYALEAACDSAAAGGGTLPGLCCVFEGGAVVHRIVDATTGR